MARCKERCVDCIHYNACAQMIDAYNNLVALLNDFLNDIGSKQKANGLGFPYETEKGRLCINYTNKKDIAVNRHGHYEKYDDSEVCYCSYCGKPSAKDDNVSWHVWCPVCGTKTDGELKKDGDIMVNDIKTALEENSGRAYSGLDEVVADEAIRRLQWIAFNFPHIENPMSKFDEICRTVNFYCKETVETLKLLRDKNAGLREERYKLLKQRQWISVKEEKPQESGNVIVYILGAIGTSTLNYDPENEVFYDDDNNHYNVTHWMPMPEMPEVE